MKFGIVDNSFYTSDYQYSQKRSNNDMQDMAYKVIQWQQYFSIQAQLFIAIK
jgi:hypothetical protein